jgi:D-3-phosphoglycerate dehydrogenase
MSKDNVVDAFGTHDFDVCWAADGEPPKDIVAIVSVKKKVDGDMLSKFPGLKLVAVCFTGYDHVDVEECKRRGVAVANVPGYSTDGVAELVFGLIFSLLRHIPRAHSHIRDGKWQWPPGNELKGKRFGLIGTGKIGMRVAEVAKAFSVSKLLGWDHYKNNAFTDTLGGEYVASLATLFLHADVIVVAVALTNDTRGLVSNKLLKLLRPDSILINCARGAIIDQSSLVEMLAQKRFRAGLDVYEMEPLADDHPIRSVPESNLVSTPHLAYKCEESLLRRHDITLANILAFFADSPQNIIS